MASGTGRLDIEELRACRVEVGGDFVEETGRYPGSMAARQVSGPTPAGGGGCSWEYESLRALICVRPAGVT